MGNEPTYVAVDTEDWWDVDNTAVDAHAALAIEKKQWTVFKLRKSMLNNKDGFNILNTKLVFKPEGTRRYQNDGDFIWEGFPSWLFLDWQLFERLSNPEGAVDTLESTLKEYAGLQGGQRNTVREGFENVNEEEIQRRVGWAKRLKRAKLFYEIAAAARDEGRLRLRLTTRFVDALKGASFEFKALCDEMHERGFQEGKKAIQISTSNKKTRSINFHEFWSIGIVLPDAVDQYAYVPTPNTRHWKWMRCGTHVDKDNGSYYTTNIIPATNDPPAAGGTVVATDLCAAPIGSTERVVPNPINTYGYVLSFGHGVYHFGAANTTEHTRIYLQQVIQDDPTDPNDEFLDPSL